MDHMLHSPGVKKSAPLAAGVEWCIEGGEGSAMHR